MQTQDEKMQTAPHHTDDEISLRELIETLLKQKLMIFLVTAIAVIASLLASQFLISPTYESRVILSITRAQDLTYNQTLLDIVAPQLDLKSDDFLDQATSPEVLESAIIQLENRNVTFQQLMRSIEYEVLSPYLLQITAQRGLPEEAEKFVTVIAAEIDRKLVQRVSESLQHFSHTREEAIKELQEEVEIMENRLADIDKYILLERSILDMPEMVPVDEERSRTTTVFSQELNPSYMRLEDRIDETKGEIEQKQLEFQSLEEDAVKITERLEASAAKPSRIVQQDEKPRKVSPNTKLNLAVALVLGLMVSVFLAFFIEYWRNSAQPNQKNYEPSSTKIDKLP